MSVHLAVRGKIRLRKAGVRVAYVALAEFRRRGFVFSLLMHLSDVSAVAIPRRVGGATPCRK
jgi:hypothetical protein